MRILDGATALANLRDNPLDRWSAGATKDSEHAASRVFQPSPRIDFDYAGRRLAAADPVFTMGSCFAREIERAIKARGGAILSTGAEIARPEFHDAIGRVRDDVFNRFTPQSMRQELEAAFGVLEGWGETALVFDRPGGNQVDLNYWPIPNGDARPAATLVRRQVAQGLVRRAAQARVVVLTLGLIEAWRHRPTGLWANHMHMKLVARRPEDFELHLLDVDQTLECLEAILALLERVHQGEGFDLVITVSPVPMEATFTGRDVVVANAESKAILRAAAGLFCERHERAHYFPSFEMVQYSPPKYVWKKDFLHITARGVESIVDLFVDRVYQPGALAASAAPAAP